jgi:plastocyanin
MWYNPGGCSKYHTLPTEDAAMKSQRIVLLALVSVLIIALLAASCSGGTVGGTKAPASSGSGSKTYNVTATEFEFRPNKFEAKVGQKVTFKVTTTSLFSARMSRRN